MKKLNLSKSIKYIFVVIILLILFLLFRKKEIIRETIPVGILHSQTGNMAISESSIINAILMAVQEINDAGGLLGKLIEPIIVDGKSDPKVFKEEAENLIKNEKVEVIFGCWTSSSRKAVKEVVEKYNNLLMYAAPYEGLESSPNIIYAGSAPNQQIIPSVTWCLRHLGKKCYLVGSDYIYSRSVSAIVKDYMTMLNGNIVGESYEIIGGSNFSNIVEDIIKTKPDFIINTVSGQSNSAFFSMLNNAGIKSDKIPVMSYSINEADLISTLNLNDLVGHYACSSYFESINSNINKKFVQKFKAKYGLSRIVNGPLETSYFNVYLWAKAVKKSGSTKAAKVIEALKNEGLYAPEGPVFVDAKTKNLWRISRIGKINKNGGFDIVWQSRKPIKPEPYPTTRSEKSWDDFTENLFKNWGNSWEKVEKN